MEMLEKDPANRPASAAAVAGSIAAIERQGQVDAAVIADAERSEAPTPQRTSTDKPPAQKRDRAGMLSPLGWTLLAGGAVGVLFALTCILVLMRSGADGKTVSTNNPPEGVDPKQEVVKVLGKEISNSIGMKLVRIPAGKFWMGSPTDEEGRGKDEEQHEVEITKDFYLGVHEVTQKQFKIVMGKNPSWFSADAMGKDKVKGMDTDDFPVESVSYADAVEFCRKLSDLPAEKRAGRKYRLPSEAEWEYSCRGGASPRAIHFGSSLSSKQANFDGNYPYGAAEKGPYLERTEKVGSYAKNGFGLFDMHGNVAEWCSDFYDKDYYGKSQRYDPQGPASGSLRVIRGGSRFSHGQCCRSAYRYCYDPDRCYNDLGFRAAQVPSE
jgi:formylglycine-generating enzyme required for sulfatase activity